MSAHSMDDDVFAPMPDLSAAGDLPAHTRIGLWLEGLITARRLRPGDRLPTEIEMAAALGVSRMTLRQTLATVGAKGLIERRRGRYGGTYVTQPRFDYSLTGLPGFTAQMRRAHIDAGARIVRSSTRAASGDARDALRLKRGERVHEIVRVRSANGDPITLEETYLPARIFPGFRALDLNDSLYRLMEREYAQGPHTAEEVIEPTRATREQAELLCLEPDQLLLMVTRTSYAVDGTAVEFARDYFRPDRTRIKLRTHVDQGEEPAT